MLIMILGGAASGKSEFAESLCMRLSEKKLYIATMEPYGDEALMHIKRHTDMRKTKGFDTLEKYTRLYECEITGYDTILLECMSTLLANEFFTDENYYENIFTGIDKLKNSCSNLVVITNQVFSDGESYGEETERYRKALGRINCTLASLADAVIEVVYGIPVMIKGEDLKNELI
ncbi:MAG TPA: bifunctional adenosylcobinamide kinase/adenosylcobinamide-phosphate guanylyltransferase [Mobilitalea sp.]|nr:bifunctional adenosylcobinamide kinase/adenosylcobinamide-phosphate guanylyltransferase [Mobilitalea sp.]